MLHKISKLWLSILVVIMLLAGILLTMITTNTGLNFIVWTTHKIMPQVHIAEHKGSLSSGIKLTGVVYQDASASLKTEISNTAIKLSLSCLLQGKICIQEAVIDGLSVELSESNNQSEAESDAATQVVSTPIPLIVDKALAKNVNLDVMGVALKWHSLQSSLSFENSTLTLSDTDWYDVALSIVDSEKQSPSTQQTPDKNSSHEIALPDVVLPMKVVVNNFHLEHFTLEQESPVVVEQLMLSGAAHESHVDIKTLQVSAFDTISKLEAQLDLIDDYPIELSGLIQILNKDLEGQTLQLGMQGSIADLTLNSVLSGPVEAELSARVQPLSPDMPFNIDLTEGQAHWPLAGEPSYLIDIDSLGLQGNLTHYETNLKGEISGTDIPKASIMASGNGNSERIDLDQLSLTMLGGEIRASLSINLDPELVLNTQLSFSNIQPGLYWPEAEGELDGKLALLASLTSQDKWSVQASDLKISGNVREQSLDVAGALQASGTANIDDLQISTQGITIAHGANNVEVRGRLDKLWHLDIGINIPDLGSSIANLGGQVSGNASMRGALKDPNVDLDLKAEGLKWQDQFSLEKAALVGHFSSLMNLSGDLELNLSRGKYQEHRLEKLTIRGSGQDGQHTLKLEALSDVLNTDLTLSGVVHPEQSLNWQGTLERVTLTMRGQQWSLDTPTPLNYLAVEQEFHAAAHCWKQADASLCFEKPLFIGSKGDIAFNLQRFELGQLQDLLPESSQLNGKVNASGQFSWSPSSSPSIHAIVQTNSGSFEHKFEQSLQVGWQSIWASIDLEEEKLALDWRIDLIENGDFYGRLSIPDVKSDNQKINGEANIDNINLSFLSPIVGDYNKINAVVDSKTAFSGPIKRPQIDGVLSLTNILVKGDVSPIEVQKGEMNLSFSGYKASLTSTMVTPEGDLHVTGQADWRRPQNWSSTIRVFADELLLNLPPTTKVKVQPDMVLSLSPQSAKIKGNIDLPWGKIIVEELPPNAIGVSKDQVILDKNLKPLETHHGFPFEVESDINIRLGDEFQLSAFGLEGRLTGQLNVSQRDLVPYVIGEVNIQEGSYRSFGQDLIIEEGKVLMNGPVDQPFVQIKAIRNPDNTQGDVTAGVLVTGPANQPKVKIFSEPSMSQARALSYLLRGQDIDGETGGNEVATTLIGLSLAQSGQVVGKIGEAFGVQNLQLDTKGAGNESQVTVSGYILPGLQVKYGVGIFDSVGEFTVRYRLMTNLYLDAISGVERAVDLIYQFEFN